VRCMANNPDPGGSVLSANPDSDSEFHLNNLDLEKVFFDSRNAYFQALGIADLWHQPVIPQIRELLTRFEREVASGAQLRCVAHVVSRSERAFVMEQVIECEDGAIVAKCRSVHVGVDSEAGAAVTLPDWLWSAVVEMEPDLDA
jgi:acyl-CoA thioesterase FadM